MCETKTCTKCGEMKPLTDFYKHKRDGTCSNCKACHRAASRAWAAKNPEKHREAVRGWAARNPEKRREDNRAWRAANPEKRRENNRAWAAKNPEKRRESNRASATAVRDRLTDAYVRTCLLRLTANVEVPQALIELKRTQIQLHRAIYERNTSPQ